MYLDGDFCAKLLAMNTGTTERHVKCCRLSMLACLRCWPIKVQRLLALSLPCFTRCMLNRDNIENYYEIFVEVPMEELFRRDQKQLYSSSQDGNQSDVVGLDQAAEFPLNPTLTVYTAARKIVNNPFAKFLT